VADGKVGKQPAFLKDVAYSAPMGGRADAALGVQQHCLVGDDATAQWADQSGDRIDDRCLARSRPSEERRETPPAAKTNVKIECPETMLYVDLKHGTSNL